jgi:hypothetical protein
VDELEDSLQPGVSPISSFPGDKDLQHATADLIASLVQPGRASRPQLLGSLCRKQRKPLATHLRSNSVTLLTRDWLYCTNSLNRNANAERDTCARRCQERELLAGACTAQNTAATNIPHTSVRVVLNGLSSGLGTSCLRADM